MKNLFVYLLIAILALSTSTAYAQKNIVGSNKFTTKEVNVQSFKKIAVLGSPDLVYTQTNSGNPKVEIYGEDNIVPLLEVTVENGTLTVKYKKNTSIKKKGKLEVRVSGPAVESMTITGSGDVYIPKGISTSDFVLKVTGSGDIEGKNITCNNLDLAVAGSGDIKLGNITVKNLTATVSGTGDITLNGTAANATYSVAGTGDITAHKLVADNVQATVAGSGDIKCHAVKTLSGKVTGAGDVGYKGNPEITFSKKGLKKL